MFSNTLSSKAMDIINSYLCLPISGHKISCPYFNNRRNKIRAGLRVLLGKGSVEDIINEVKLISIREKIDLKKISDLELKKFLIEHNIGIDCSGLVYYILDAEVKAQGKGGLKQHLKFPFAKNPIRKLLAKIRPAENANVKTFAHEKNSVEIKMDEIQPGNIITLIAGKKFNNPDHILLIHQVDYEKNNPVIIYYTHSFQWPSDGKFGHGVRQGKIEIINRTKNLFNQKWMENEKTGDDNWTYQNVKNAEYFLIKRIKIK